MGDDGGEGSQFRIALPDSRHLKTYRREADPQWEEVRTAFLDDTLQAGCIRTHTPSSSPSFKPTRTTLMTYAVRTAAWECALQGHPSKPAEEYLGPSFLQYLPGDLCWEEAIAVNAKKLISSGKVPWT